MNSLSLNLDPEQFLAGWRADAGTLFVPALTDAHVNDQVAVRIGLFQHPVRATVHGRVSMVRRVGRPSLPPGVEIHLDPGSVPAASYLASVASGEPFTFEQRAPRFTGEHRMVAELGCGRTTVRTVNVSEGGCCIAWPEPPAPSSGEILKFRLPGSLLAPKVDGVVCWVSEEAPERTVGVRLVSGGRGGRAWRSLVDEIARRHPRTV